METIVRRIGLVAHDAMKKDMIEWVLWNSERLIGHKFYCTGTTGTLIKKALEEKHPEIKWDITILKSGPLGGDQQIGSRIVEGEIDYLFFFTDPMTLQPHDTDVKALTRLAGVENIVFCCNRSIFMANSSNAFLSKHTVSITIRFYVDTSNSYHPEKRSLVVPV